MTINVFAFIVIKRKGNSKLQILIKKVTESYNKQKQQQLKKEHL